MTRFHCVGALADRIMGAPLGRPTRVGIDGVDGVGKTTLADELAERLTGGGRQIIRASVDGFHRTRSQRYARGEYSAEGYFLDSFDYPALRERLLGPLGPNGNRRFRVALFDHRTDQFVDPAEQIAADDSILIFDGVFLQRPELAGAWDLCVWVEAPTRITVERGVRRDSADAHQMASVLEKYERRYVPGQRIYVDLFHPREAAHVIVNNADFEHPELQFRITEEK